MTRVCTSSATSFTVFAGPSPPLSAPPIARTRRPVTSNDRVLVHVTGLDVPTGERVGKPLWEVRCPGDKTGAFRLGRPEDELMRTPFDRRPMPPTTRTTLPPTSPTGQPQHCAESAGSKPLGGSRLLRVYTH